MIITECYIENFGGLSNFLYKPEAGFNCICEKNGFGKSTFAAFIGAMFYGMVPTRNRKSIEAAERKKYKPWNGKVCGGYICFKCDDKEYRMERTFADKDSQDTYRLIDCLSGMDCDDFPVNPGSAIFGIDKQAFMSTLFIRHSSMRVNVNDSIVSRLEQSETGIFDDADIYVNYEQAISDLEGAYKEYVKTGNRGYIADLRKKISIYESEDLKIKDACNELNDKIKKENLIEPEKGGGLSKEEYKRLEWFDDYFSKGIPKVNELRDMEINLSRDKLNIENEYNKSLIRKRDKRRQKYLGIACAVLSVAVAALAAINKISYLYAVSAFILAVCIFLINKTLVAYRKHQLNTCKYANSNYNIRIEQINKKLEKVKREMEYIKEYNRLADKEKMYEEMSVLLAKKNKDNQIASLNLQLSEMKQKQFENSLIIEKLKQELSDCRKEAELIHKTLQYLNEAWNSYTKDYVRKISKAMRKYLKVFDTVMASKVKVNSNYEISLDDHGALRQTDFYSSGMKDILWLCERFSFIESIYEGKAPIIIMDDPFVNFDDESLKCALRLTKELSENSQVIYMTCSKLRAV